MMKWKNKLTVRQALVWLFIYLLLFVTTFFITGYFSKNYQKSNLPIELLGGLKDVKGNGLFGLFEVFEILSKEMQVPPVENAIIYAYISNIYFDILSRDNFSNKSYSHADEAVFRFLLKKFPNSVIYLKHSREKNQGNKVKLSSEDLAILNRYLKKFEEETRKVYIKNNLYQANGTWKIKIAPGEQRTPDTPGASEYSKWLVGEDFNFLLPVPSYFNNNRVLNSEYLNLKNNTSVFSERMENILHWNAGRGGQSLPYIWQKLLIKNLLNSDLSEMEILEKQKQLAELLADVYVLVYENKYKYQIYRPEQVFTGLAIPVKVPKNPSFPASHSAICVVASSFLSKVDVTNTKEYEMEVGNCVESRMNLGVEFNEDVLYGKILGEEVFKYVEPRF